MHLLRQIKARTIVSHRLFLVTWVFLQILCRHRCYQTLAFCHALLLETCQNTAPVPEAGRRACRETLERSFLLWSPVDKPKSWEESPPPLQRTHPRHSNWGPNQCDTLSWEWVVFIIKKSSLGEMGSKPTEPIGWSLGDQTVDNIIMQTRIG